MAEEQDPDQPEIKVLAIASHVVYGYVGNKMATFVMQALGLDVAAMNTVHFSNHTGYRRFTGTRTPHTELTSLYQGLQASNLTSFSMLLTGYIPNAPSVDAVGAIARDLRAKSPSPGGFFWVLDPVMGDQGRLYVEEAIVGKYRALVGEADLVLPNQFEAELLAGVETGLIGETGEKGAREVIRALHGMGVKHVVITSIRTKGRKGLVVVGSSADSKGQVRGWKIKVPEYRCFFSGTGDMFAGLMVGRLREEVVKLGGKEVLGTKGWVSPDHVRGEETPLARAAEKVLSSMQMVLEKTMLARDREMEKFDQKDDGRGVGESGEGEENMTPETRRYLAETKAAEVRVVKNWRDLVEPEQRYKAEPLDL